MEIHRLQGREAVSQLFSFRVEVTSKGEPPSGTELAGCGVELVFEREEQVYRRIHAVVADVEEDLEEENAFYTLVFHLVPRAHWLTLVEVQEIYQHLTVPTIIEQKLAMVGLEADSAMRLSSSYEERDFVVQYRESDLSFVSRLAEHIGISFFFEEKDGSTQIVFTDHNEGFGKVDAHHQLNYRGRGERKDVFELRARTQVLPSEFVMMDYNYRTPQVDLTSTATADHGFAGGVTEYGAHYRSPAAGRRFAQIRAEASDSRYRVYHAESTLAEVAAGHRYHLAGHPRVPEAELLVTTVEHEAVQSVFGRELGTSYYRNRFTAIDARQTYRPPRVTPKPRIVGWIHGVVQPRPEQEVGDFAQLDNWGRYVVKFLFDIAEHPELQASKPVRMAQPHVGPDHGMHFPLRPGVEVALAFMEGDPDRPVIVGAIHNARTPDHVTEANPKLNRIRTGTGVQITIQDAR